MPENAFILLKNRKNHRARTLQPQTRLPPAAEGVLVLVLQQ